jgi:hypothetical protein
MKLSNSLYYNELSPPRHALSSLSPVQTPAGFKPALSLLFVFLLCFCAAGFLSCGGGDGPGYIPSGLTPGGGGGTGGGGKVLNAATTGEWNAALADITSGGDGTLSTPKKYTIAVSGDFSVPGNNTLITTFGNVQYIRVTLAGTGTVSLLDQGNLLRLAAANQTLVIDGPGLVLQGLTSGQNAAIVSLNASTAALELRNGTITGNSNSNNGGGVYVSGGSFIMSGGTISGNSAGSSGGGVSVYGGSFDMSGGEISGNSGGVEGGGVWIVGGSFTMSGTAKISGNSVSNKGGGVCIYTGSFSKSGGGIIYGYSDSPGALRNKAHNGDDTWGHAVYFYNAAGIHEYYRDTTLDAGDDISTEVLPPSPDSNWIEK